jgi:predicted CXXCH cytochrome family protein
MKKVILTVAALALSASAAFGFGSSNGSAYITGTPHDLSSKITVGEKQICVFCHTPHNAAKNIPLWNRNDGSQMVLLYNTSVTLSSIAAAVTPSSFPTDSISSFCMSCHDGVTALGAIKNDPTNMGDATITTGTAKKVIAMGAAGSAYTGSSSILGTNLADDHPVAFDYNKAYLASADTSTGNASDVRLRPIATVQSRMQATRIFFNSGINATTGIAANVNQIECASCHKVHDDFYAPFLRMSNKNSALCLACHNK